MVASSSYATSCVCILYWLDTYRIYSEVVYIIIYYMNEAMTSNLSNETIFVHEASSPAAHTDRVYT